MANLFKYTSPNLRDSLMGKAIAELAHFSDLNLMVFIATRNKRESTTEVNPELERLLEAAQQVAAAIKSIPATDMRPELEAVRKALEQQIKSEAINRREILKFLGRIKVSEKPKVSSHEKLDEILFLLRTIQAQM